MKNFNIVRKLAYSFSRTTGINYDELLCEASLQYCEACRLYSSTSTSKASITTYAYSFVRNSLIHFIRKEERRRRLSKFTDLSKQYDNGNPNQYEEQYGNGEDSQFADSISNKREGRYFFEIYDYEFSKDAREVADTIIGNPQHYLEHSPKHARGVLYRELRDRNWKYERIWKTFRELKKVLNTSG